MYSRFSEHSLYINVPYRLAKRYRNDKRKWDLLVFAVCLKLQRGDSGLYLLDAKALMRALHCSYRKAQRLMRDAASDNVLFNYNEKTKFISAKVFRNGCQTFYSKGRRPKLFYADDVFCVEKGQDGIISHKEISVQMRDLLIKKMLKAQAPSDDLRCHDSVCSEKRKPLTQEFIGNCAGLHQTTVSRRVRKMEKDMEVKITRHPLVPVCDLATGAIINEPPANRKPFVSGRFAFIRDVNEYEILDSSIYMRFKHLIYNHKKRFTENKIIKPWDNCYFN